MWIWVEVDVSMVVVEVVVEVCESFADGIRDVLIVVLPAASLTAGAKVKFSSTALPSRTWTPLTVIAVKLQTEKCVLEGFN